MVSADGPEPNIVEWPGRLGEASLPVNCERREGKGRKMGCGKECGVSLVQWSVSCAVGLFAVPQSRGQWVVRGQNWYATGQNLTVVGFVGYQAPTHNDSFVRRRAFYGRLALDATKFKKMNKF